MNPVADRSQSTAVSRKRATDLLERASTLALCTERSGEILRTFLSSAMEEVHCKLRPWFQSAGAITSVDDAGNFRALYLADCESAPQRLVIASHLDTVANAGAYDGVLGVLLGLSLVESLEGRRFSFEIEVIGFSDEEGTRFDIPFIGSRFFVGEGNDTALLNAKDPTGVTVRDALEQYRQEHPEALPGVFAPNAAAYVEFHIEQGPVLESRELPLGVVESIAGQSRCDLLFRGKSGHAGTSPMALRHDALAAAAEWMTHCEAIAAQTNGLVATVGKIAAEPGAVNVIPGIVRCSLDVRHPDDSIRRRATDAILDTARNVAYRRVLSLEAKEYHSQPAVRLDGEMIRLAEEAVGDSGRQCIRMTSGAGHDAMIVAPHLPSCMLFLRSPGGISHHPDESVLVEDVEAAIEAGLHLLKRFELTSKARQRA